MIEPVNTIHKAIPGVDIVEITRIRNMQKKWGDKFLHRVFTDEELKYCLGKAGSPAHLAGRFAAKEAVIKLLKTEKSPDLKSVEILRGKNGEPLVQLGKDAKILAEQKQIRDITISISHSRYFAVAFAIAMI